MTDTPDNTADGQSGLVIVEQAAAGVIRREEVSRATRRGFEDAAWLLLIIPTFWLSVRLAGGMSGLSLMDFSLPWVLLFTPIPSLVYLALVRWAAGRRSIDRRRALALVDHRFGLKDRLVTADEFLGLEKRTPFMEAAIVDGLDRLPRLMTTSLEGGAVSQAPGRKILVPLILAGTIVCLSLLVGPPPGGGRVWGVAPTAFPLAEAVARTEESDESSDTTEPRREETTTAVAPGRDPGKPGRQAQETQGLTPEIKKTDGRTQAGRPSDAASSSGRGQSRGVPSNQPQVGMASDKKGKKTVPKNKSKAKPKAPTEKTEPEDESGATAGRGSATGSNRSPASSTWSSRDRVVSEDEEDLDEDEDVEDEFDDQESRGGLQPHLRDRRPPVNRDLSIGFGNQKNPDANGRGGQSEQKKSRGVASLVLGVPIPDHIKGRPNPGKTKVTQERVEPRAEEAQRTDAESRTPREGAMGWLRNPVLEPWMQSLVKRYFEAVRENAQEKESVRKQP